MNGVSVQQVKPSCLNNPIGHNWQIKDTAAICITTQRLNSANELKYLSLNLFTNSRISVVVQKHTGCDLQDLPGDFNCSTAIISCFSLKCGEFYSNKICSSY
jgi:hypothetical protein